MGEEQWYTNKDLFEMMQGLKAELAQTRADIKQYNNLRAQLADLQTRSVQWDAHLSAQVGTSKVADAIRQWGGWFVAIAALVVNILN
jgi:hypothetical protein